MSDQQKVYSITRPSSKLMTLYTIQSCLLPPISFLAFPFLFARYKSMQYEFDDQGISMSWGILWKKQVNLTYKRIQDIHVTAGVLQRWLGLADLHIQTASGSSQAEMKLEGLLEYKVVQEFIYRKMRGNEDVATAGRGPVAPVASVANLEQERKMMEALSGIQGELRASRQLMEQVLQQSNRGD
ncbi:MAG: PH domain-containing protein [Sumerlaeia bacterium]